MDLKHQNLVPLFLVMMSPPYTLEKKKLCGSRRIGKLAKIALGGVRFAAFAFPWPRPCLFVHFELNTLPSLLIFHFLFLVIVVCYTRSTTNCLLTNKLKVKMPVKIAQAVDSSFTHVHAIASAITSQYDKYEVPYA